MHIGVLGINHKSADLTYREKVARACSKKLHFEEESACKLSCVPLLTCHRTEIYFSAEDLAVAHSTLLNLLREEISQPFEHKLYAYFGSDCFTHLAQVTAGLDSVIVAESEIQRQVKQAYEQACLHYVLPSAMHYLFQKSLQLGKYLRSHFILPQGQITIPRMMYEICFHLFSDVQKLHTLFIGNSEINRKAISYFNKKAMGAFSLCTRSVHSAQEIAQQQHLQIWDWSHLSRWGEYDIIIAGTNTSSYLLYSDEHPVKTRVIFDLGVPRNIDPGLAKHPHITLFNIDTLAEMMEEKLTKHVSAVKKMEEIIQEKVHNYILSFNEKRIHVSTLCG